VIGDLDCTDLAVAKIVRNINKRIPNAELKWWTRKGKTEVRGRDEAYDSESKISEGLRKARPAHLPATVRLFLPPLTAKLSAGPGFWE
jgi:hypothetical protein